MKLSLSSMLFAFLVVNVQLPSAFALFDCPAGEINTCTASGTCPGGKLVSATLAGAQFDCESAFQVLDRACRGAVNDNGLACSCECEPEVVVVIANELDRKAAFTAFWPSSPCDR